MLADAGIDRRRALLTIDWCAGVLDQRQTDTHESGIAKVAVSEALYRVADRCVQVLGGLGVTEDTPVQQIFRDIRAFRTYDGPSEVHRWSIAKPLKKGRQPGRADALPAGSHGAQPRRAPRLRRPPRTS